MSEAMTTDPRFGDAPRAATPAAESAVSTLRGSLGAKLAPTIDAMHDEALARARLGMFADAEARLRALLLLDTEDVGARILLARVLEAAGRPDAALLELDAAQRTHEDHPTPAGMRDRLEQAAKSQRKGDDDTRVRVAAREQGELRGLRAEARTLRSELLQSQAETEAARRASGHWRVATTIASVFGVVLILVIGLRDKGPVVDTTPRTAQEAALDLSLDGKGGDRTREILGAAPGGVGAATPAAAPAQTAATAPPATPPVVPVDAPATAAPPAAPAEAPAAPEPATPAPRAKSSTKDACTEAKTAESGPCTHTVTSGDTFGGLARRYYGKSSLATKIEKANKTRLKKKGFKPGVEIVIP